MEHADGISALRQLKGIGHRARLGLFYDAVNDALRWATPFPLSPSKASAVINGDVNLARILDTGDLNGEGPSRQWQLISKQNDTPTGKKTFHNTVPFFCGDHIVELLLSEARPIPSHALIALFAIVLGGAQFLMTRGNNGSSLVGRIWVSAMFYVAISSFFIHELKVWGDFSPIHLLSIWTLFSGLRHSPCAHREN